MVARYGLVGLEALLKRLLSRLQLETPLKPGYAAGNMLNLLLHLEVDVSGYDFSGLCVWQAYLQAVDLAAVNFRGTGLTGCLFNDCFGNIHPLAFSPDGEWLADGTKEGRIRLWHAADGRQHITFPGHENLT